MTTQSSQPHQLAPAPVDLFCMTMPPGAVTTVENNSRRVANLNYYHTREKTILRHFANDDTNYLNAREFRSCSNV